MENPDLVQAADLERETGLGKDLLRKWRARYGFPAPVADGGGGQGYPREQIRQLRLIKKLLDTGFRPAQVAGKSLAELERMEGAIGDPGAVRQAAPLIDAAVALLREHAIDALEELLEGDLGARGAAGFARETAAPLADAIGAAWARGELATFQEHRCSAIVARLLSPPAGAPRPAPHAPRILFATPPEELHVLGLLMVQAVLAERGAYCIGVGSQTSIDEADMATRAYRADIVCLSFSAAYPPRRVRPFLAALRARLPAAVPIWAGGAGVAHVKRAPAGVCLFSDLRLPLTALSEWIDSSPAGRRDGSLNGAV